MEAGTCGNPITFTYKGVVCKQNPLTGDWLVDLGERFGSYYCGTKAECQKLIDEAAKR